MEAVLRQPRMLNGVRVWWVVGVRGARVCGGSQQVACRPARGVCAVRCRCVGVWCSGAVLGMRMGRYAKPGVSVRGRTPSLPQPHRSAIHPGAGACGVVRPQPSVWCVLWACVNVRPVIHG